MPAEFVLGGHGEPIVDHVALIDDRIAKHEKRKEKIFKLIAERPRSGYEIAQAIWGNVAVTQAFLTLSEVIGHADLLVNEGRVREVGRRRGRSATKRPASAVPQASTWTSTLYWSTPTRWPMPPPGGLIELRVSSPWR